MKPSPADLELIFLREAERRIGYLYDALLGGRNGIPEALGLKSLVNNRIAEVTKHRDEKEGGPCPSSASGREQ